MVVDNFNLISNILTFNNENEFYYLQILQRKKDGNVVKDYNRIKTYFIYNKEQLLSEKDKIKEICINNNARAYIHLNRRNAEEIALYAIQEYAKIVQEGNSNRGHKIYELMCGRYKASGYKSLWIVDLDTKDETIINKYIAIINKCRSNDNKRVKYIIPTINGYHLITIGFDLAEFYQLLLAEDLESVIIQKNNPTLLYYSSEKSVFLITYIYYFTY